MMRSNLDANLVHLMLYTRREENYKDIFGFHSLLTMAMRQMEINEIKEQSLKCTEANRAQDFCHQYRSIAKTRFSIRFVIHSQFSLTIE